ncbi:hypothetical protein AVEN_230391-1 [Araneus ventricosus]|uniref:Uncharacterized protein n=1 Tax=Araneus ventricosus TaxID=182803 RepID=A0A4Y2T446_ARAVE|nr:hypothetical protein AVEN_230391-1 [Araneus ventricosus]
MKVKLLRGAHAWWGCGRKRELSASWLFAQECVKHDKDFLLVFAFPQSRSASTSVGNSWIRVFTSFSAFMDSFRSVISSAASMVFSSVFSSFLFLSAVACA